MELDEAHTWLKEMQSKVEAVLQLAQQSTEEKTAALLTRQKEIETQLEEARGQITSLRQKESETREQYLKDEEAKEATMLSGVGAARSSPKPSITAVNFHHTSHIFLQASLCRGI